ncbi:MAG TPA: type III secretion system effector protein [Xanthomonadales bacterium]|nr:type III secretion system effector protein [Xanthomonadales bacterium]
MMILPTSYAGIYVSTANDSPASAHSYKEEAQQALDRIASGPSGGELLSKVAKIASGGEKKITLKELGPNEEPYTQAVLTRSQIEKYKPRGFEQNVAIAGELSRKGRFLKGEGTSAIIGWSPEKSSVLLNQNGSPTRIGASQEEKFTVLAHELIHARHIMSGSSLAAGGNRYDPKTPNGKEESRAVGVEGYHYSKTKKPSENSIRAEQGLPLRKKYNPHDM